MQVTLVTVTHPWWAFDMAPKAREGNRDPLHQFEEIAAASAKAVLNAAGQNAKLRALPVNTSACRSYIPPGVSFQPLNTAT